MSLVLVGTVNLVDERVDFAGISLPDGYYMLAGFPAVIPEPSTFVLTLLGCVGLERRRRRPPA